MRSFVYRWTDNLTGKLYIGVHKGTEYDGYVCSSRVMMKEYDVRPQDFIREILKTFDDYMEARAYEIELLTEVNAAANTCYYNMSNGGKPLFYSPKGTIKPDHWKKNMSARMKGRVVSEVTRAKLRGKRPETTCRAISEGKKGNIPWNKGIPRSEDTKMKISETKKKNPKPQTEEHRRKNSEANTGKKWFYDPLTGKTTFAFPDTVPCHYLRGRHG